MSDSPQVYFAVREDTGLVKIGFSASPDRRIRNISTTINLPVKIIRVEPGGRKVEAWFHDKFDRLRVYGEWFYYDETMLTLSPSEEEKAVLFAEDEPRARGSKGFRRVVSETLKEQFKHYRAKYRMIGNAIGSDQRAVKGWLDQDVGPTGESLISLMALSPSLERAVLELVREERDLQSKIQTERAA